MNVSTLKRIVTAILVVGALGVGAIVLWGRLETARESATARTQQGSGEARRAIIGTSVEGRPIEAYTYSPATSGGSDKARIRPGGLSTSSLDARSHLVFVGGVHGGYEWNSVLLAYTFMDYLDANKSFIPEDVEVTVIPSANPDGVYKVIGKEGRFSAMEVSAKVDSVPGRFNAHQVDLNRNFDCKWKSESMWKGNKVSAGSAPFSEPETKAIRDFVLKNKPDAVVFWHSQANAVYASECENGILAKTRDIMKAYSKASGYPAVDSFDAYEVTGDAEGWLASINIPAITVELATHETVEWKKNLAGIEALLVLYSQSN